MVGPLGLLTACGAGFGDDDPLTDQPAVIAPSELPVPVASAPRVGAAGTVNALTGEPVPDGRVLAVVLDDSPAARPQAGLAQADVVYLEEAEDGATRLLALFQTEVPTRVGPVGPARAGDVALLGPHGAVALAFTDAAPDVEAQLSAADLQPVSLAAGPEGFTQDPERDPAADVVGDGTALLARAPGSGVARDVGFRFGPGPDDAAPAAAASYAWDAATVDFAWSAEEDAWLLQRDGEPVQDEAGEPVRTDNVLFTEGSDGSGTATLLRDGTAVEGSREDLLLDVGTTWVVLVADGGSPTVTEG